MIETAVVDSSEFFKALDNVSGVLKKSPVNVMEGALISISVGKCVITASDLETWAQREIPARGDTFSFVLCRTKELLKAFKDSTGPLELGLNKERDGNLRAIFTCGRRSASFEAEPSESYPAKPELTAEVETELTVNAAQLAERIGRISYAAAAPSPEEHHRTARSSVQFMGNAIYAVDGYRMSCDRDDSLVFPKPMLLPARSLAHLKLFGNSQVTIASDGRYVKFFSSDAELLVNTVKDIPVVVDNVVPKTFRGELLISPREWINELNYLLRLIPKGRSPLALFSNGRITVNAGTESYITEVDVEGRSEMYVGFNIHYMIDALKQFASEAQVRLRLSGEYTPMVLEAGGREDFALVLPVRMNRTSMAA